MYSLGPSIPPGVARPNRIHGKGRCGVITFQQYRWVDIRTFILSAHFLVAVPGWFHARFTKAISPSSPLQHPINPYSNNATDYLTHSFTIRVLETSFQGHVWTGLKGAVLWPSLGVELRKNNPTYNLSILDRELCPGFERKFRGPSRSDSRAKVSTVRRWRWRR